MFCNQLSQTLVLNHPERPRVSSRFENKFGEYTTAIRRTPSVAKVIGVFERNALQKVYAFEYEDGTAAVHFAAPVKHLTESYGYRLDNSFLDGVEVGDDLPAQFKLQGWPCTDEYGNFAYGVNLRTAYMNLDGLTYEDGIIISESTAERLAHTEVSEVTVVLNANDLPLNLYGTPDEDNYKGFPDVGEDIQNGVLLTRRRINHESALFDLSTPQLSRINWDADTPFWADGTVVDIEVFTNLNVAELEKHPYHRQVLALQRRWQAFQHWVLDTFRPYLEGGKYSEDVAYWHRRCRDTLDGKWRHDKSEYEGTVLRFTIARRCPLEKGSKLTNR